MVFSLAAANHKHFFRIKRTHKFRSQLWTELHCEHCEQYLLVEHGWFKEGIRFHAKP